MADEVWPLKPDEQVPLSSFNGIGFGLKGFTRKDAHGRYFGTRYFTVLYLPIVPLDRFYLAEVSSDFQNRGVSQKTVTHYQIAGRSRLRGGEVLLTYLANWIVAPGIVLGPIALLLGNADQLAESIGLMWVIFGFIGWLFLSLWGVGYLAKHYRSHWSPLREAEPIASPPGT